MNSNEQTETCLRCGSFSRQLVCKECEKKTSSKRYPLRTHAVLASFAPAALSCPISIVTSDFDNCGFAAIILCPILSILILISEMFREDLYEKPFVFPEITIKRSVGFVVVGCLFFQILLLSDFNIVVGICLFLFYSGVRLFLFKKVGKDFIALAIIDLLLTLLIYAFFYVKYNVTTVDKFVVYILTCHRFAEFLTLFSLLLQERIINRAR